MKGSKKWGREEEGEEEEEEKKQEGRRKNIKCIKSIC